MYQYRKISDDLFWVGGNDRRLALFESAYPVPRGISYNAYVLRDEKTALLDTVDHAVSRTLFENLKELLGERPLDYVVVNHMEPDHCASLEELVTRYPEVKIVGSQKTLGMLKQFFDFDVDSRFVTVAEGDCLSLGRHQLSFYMAPMVHWPEVMVTFDHADGTLFSADAFGTFGAVDGNLYADEVDFENQRLAEARRYYANIVGKYGPQVQQLLKKVAGLPVERICPLHGPIWRENIGWFVEKYDTWSRYEPEEQAVLIAYSSVYGDTQNAAEILAGELADRGVKNIAMYDVSVTHPGVIVSEAFRCSHLVFATTTYNNGIFVTMETVLHDLEAHMLQNRTVALIENGSWAPTAGKKMKQLFEGMKDIRLLESMVTIKSAVKPAQREALLALAEAIARDMHGEPAPEEAAPAEEAGAKKIIGYKCDICGYMYEGATLPEGFVCPICGMDASHFVPVEG